jgi:hypothetical protein
LKQAIQEETHAATDEPRVAAQYANRGIGGTGVVLGCLETSVEIHLMRTEEALNRNLRHPIDYWCTPEVPSV